MPDSLLPKQPLEGPVQLTNCDREPIHIPGTIQPHGQLLAVDLSNETISHVSENIHIALGKKPEELLGRHYTDDLPWLAERLDHLQARATGTRFRLQQSLPQGTFAITLHIHEGLLIAELEAPIDSGLVVQEFMGSLFSQLNGSSLQDAYNSIVNKVQQLAGFDRVMLYQLMEDGHGSVIAEAKADNAEAFLGLHYPATDIPQPARRLYELNWLRLISDIDATPCPILARDPAAPPLDLSYATLRSISPIHVEYLRNMQVGASMSISVMDGENLWGLIACHHNSPRVVPPDVRDGCELSGSILSSYLTSRRQQEYLKRQVDSSEQITQQLSQVAQFENVEAGLERIAPGLCELLEADGMVWQNNEDQFCWGQVPNQNAIAHLLTALDSRSEEAIVFTDQISKWLDSAQHYSDLCAGLLSIRLGHREAGVLLFFRSPYQHTVTWAGNPEKSTQDPNGRLTPRKSFEAWQQSVQGRSRPWTRADLQTARNLYTGLQTMIVEQGAKLRRINEELRQLNTDLDAFAYAASHDLKEPLRGLNHYIYQLEHTVPEDDPEVQQSMSGLKRIIRRMSDLLDGLLRFSRAGRADLERETFRLSEIVPEAEDILFAGSPPPDVQIVLQQDGMVFGDYSCVREILCNLISNGIKYNESPEKKIVLGIAPLSQTPLRRKAGGQNQAIYVRDNGIGIAPEHLPQVFEIFTRLHDRDAYGGGSGAGLTIVRRLVERHDGTVVAESSSQGTTFYFCLGEAE